MFIHEIKPRFSDLDGLNHVNNANYLTYFELARTEWYVQNYGEIPANEFDFIIAHAEIDFISPINFDSKVTIRMWVSKVGSKSWEFSYELSEGDKIFARGKTVQVTLNYQTYQTILIPEKYSEQLNKLKP